MQLDKHNILCDLLIPTCSMDYKSNCSCYVPLCWLRAALIIWNK